MENESGLMADCEKFFTLPPQVNVADYVLEKCQNLAHHHRHPCITNPVTGESIRYGDIERCSAQVATYLRERGMKKGDILISLAHNGAKLHAFFIGVWRIGGIVRCSYPEDVGDTLTSRIVNSGAKFVLCDENTAADCLVSVAAAATVNGGDSEILEKPEVIVFGKVNGCTSVDDIFGRPTQNLQKITTDPDDVALLLPTSGTTGESKAVIYTHKILLKNILLFEKFPFIGDQEKAFTLITGKQTHFTGAVCPLAFMAAGRSLLMMSQVSQENIMMAVEKYRVKSIFSFPKFLTGLVTCTQASNYDLTSINYLSTAGMVVGPSFMNTVKMIPNVRAVMTIYGMTEVGFLTANVHWSVNATGSIRSRIDESQVLSSGRLGPGSSLQVRDIDTGEILGATQKGELCFKSELACSSYWKNSTGTRETFRDGWVYTGDLGYFDSEGRVYVVNRLKEIFKYFNNHINPSEIENVILEHPSVNEACVVGVPDPVGGDMIPRAFVTTKKRKSSGSTECPESILQFTNSKVPSYKTLRGGLFILDDFPRGKSGKILRNALTTLQVQQLS